MTDQPTGDDQAGLVGGRYRLGELLGVGGSASVFAAEDVEPGREDVVRRRIGAEANVERVAVKILHPHLSEDAAVRDAFFREARAAAPLQHHNVAAIRGFGVHNAGGITMAWIALDLVDGPTLAERVTVRGPMRPAEAAAVVDGVLAALEAAHRIGLVHRDVSPQNILLDGVFGTWASDSPGPSDGAPICSEQVRLVDFGLAAAAGLTAVGGDVLLSVDEEGAGSGSGGAVGVVGNASFLSPEHAQGKPVRAAGDLYQAGAVLYFLLTGRTPYPRPTTAQVLDAHISAPPPVPSVLVAAARPFDRIVTRAMTKTPARRFRDATEFRAALAEAVAVVEAAERATADDVGGTGDANGMDGPDHAGGSGGSGGADGAVTEVAGESNRPTEVLTVGGAGSLDYLSAGPEGDPDQPAGSSTPAVSGTTGIAALIVAVVVLGFAGWGVLAASAGGAPEPSASPAVSASEPVVVAAEEPAAQQSDAPSTAPPAAGPVAGQVVVPTLFGQLSEAETVLRDAGLVRGGVTRVESADAADRVLGQSPSPGLSVAAGTPIDLTVASGNNTVPGVGGMTAAAAAAQLRAAGFVVPDDRGGIPADAEVTGTRPGVGSLLRVGATVTLLAVVDTPTPSTAPTAAAGSGT